MMHFTCDRCGKDLTTAQTDHFVVKVEAFAAFDPDRVKDEDLDEDHLEVLAGVLAEHPDPADLDLSQSRELRFDLCPACHRKFLRDPLGRESLRALKFSKN